MAVYGFDEGKNKYEVIPKSSLSTVEVGYFSLSSGYTREGYMDVSDIVDNASNWAVVSYYYNMRVANNVIYRGGVFGGQGDTVGINIEVPRLYLATEDGNTKLFYQIKNPSSKDCAILSFKAILMKVA